MKWKTMDEFCPPSHRLFNNSTDMRQWYWVSWGEEVYLCYWQPPGHFLPVNGGVVVGAHPKYWMPLDVPDAPLTPELEAELVRLRKAAQSHQSLDATSN